MNKLYVRVAPKSGNTQFYRCAILFTLAWLLVEVDNATAARLHEEQMLEVSDKEPVDYVEPQTEGGLAEKSEVESPTVLDRIAEIKTAIGKLSKDVPSNWLKSGAPSAPAITALVGFDVTAAYRDQAWAELEAERLAAENATGTGAKA
jgi:hypothetical protein